MSDAQVGVGDGAEAALVAGLVAQRAVQERQHPGGAALVGGRGAHRVARERGHGGGVRALALNVADQRRPGPVARREEVVEVAAELDPLARRPEAHRRAQATDRGQRARPQRALQRAGDRPLAVVELGVDDRDRRELRELGQDRLVTRAELALVGVDDLEHAELVPEPGQVRRQPRGVQLAAAEARGRGGRQRSQPRVGRQDRDRGPGRVDDLARRVGRQLQDRLDRERAVDRHRGVRQRAQLLDVRVLDARDLLDLEVAAVDGLERRQALAQEVGRGVQRGLVDAALQRVVVRVGEVEHAQLGGDGLAAEVVRGAERLLGALGEIRGEGRRVARGEAVGAVLAPHVRWEAYATNDGCGPVGGPRCRGARRGSRSRWSTGR